MKQRMYRVGASTVTAIFGDITTSKAEVLVSSDDTWLSAGGGVSNAISRAGGEAVQADAAKLRDHPIGDVVVTGAGYLPAKYIFHAITIGPDSGDIDPAIIVRNATRKALHMLPLLGCSSIAFPTIGAGVAGIPFQTVVAEMAEALMDVLLDDPRAFKVELYLWNRHSGLTEGELFAVIEMVAAVKFASGVKPAEAEGVSQRIEPGDATASPRREEIYRMVRHLDARRQQLESRLVDLLVTDGDNQTLQSIKAQLAELSGLRAQYEREMAGLASPGRATGEDSVFVSSTSQDLGAYRAAVRGVVEQLSLRFIGMEDFTPEASPPAAMIRRRVQESAIYVGILGMRYGHIDEGTGLSMTELEYQQAVAGDKPLRIFVMDEDAPITANMVERDPTSLDKLNAFRARVMHQHSCSLFKTKDDLAEKVRRALAPA